MFVLDRQFHAVCRMAWCALVAKLANSFELSNFFGGYFTGTFLLVFVLVLMFALIVMSKFLLFFDMIMVSCRFDKHDIVSCSFLYFM